ncbi:uncharacterized protein K441DRAFT_273650 [Cenococcum geophilum 1.58]|uniref:uncharacterized protein n=1 Tax=Cenococcum geophilum 1.58 TaxID=794803 RepID=UPI00358F1FD8|nr:hypothetical protein K441DRAFT_273650 [Cenococcum geophilum 1.58]
MPTIGAYVCIWANLLLLLCIPLAQSTNETTGLESPSISSASIASASISQSSSTTTAASVKLPAAYSSSTCQSRTINYITHTLPQQCLKTSWSASSRAAAADAEASEAIASAGTLVLRWWGDGAGDRFKGTESGPDSPEPSLPSPTGDIAPDSASPAHSIAAGASPAIPSPTGTASTEPEVETDSPLDNANFLSFEEWKKQNLARAGQSPENVGQGRGASSGSGGRRRPVSINNALDSLGEDAEIELDFGGFGDAGQADGGTASWASGTRQRSDASKTGDEGENVPPSSRARSKDAGKTCKERFNYASFDCAATVLKTNQQCKSSSSVLVENKDSYMLNECAAQNKFIIVELCDDILIDTIVLANFEFFSSMFRTFRISVSDRYPVKFDRWKELGVFEARNSRDIQAFLVENPLIWARYLRLEFLSHYGNEYYCPVSLLRVHGTTMMEEFRHQEEAARGEYDFAEPIEEAEGEPVTTAMPVAEEDAAGGALEIPSEHVKVTEPSSVEEFRKEEDASQSVTQENPRSHHAEPEPVQDTQKGSQNESVQPAQLTNIELSTSETQNGSQPPSDARKAASASPINGTHGGSAGTASAASGGAERSDPAPSGSDSTSMGASSPTSSSQNATSDSSASTSHAASKPSTNDTPSAPPTKPPSPSTDQAQTRPLPSHTQPQPANPTTQESFFKSIHKRLQQLESNSTLSLQYIEEQSRILRDAFIHVEKRQLTKTTTFLATLNTSVLAELKAYRVQYDQLWQSTILELESHRESHEAEMGAVSARLSLLADELVWQKRMAVVQSTLLLLCLGLVLFVRSGTLGAQLDAPIVQQLVHSASLAAKRGFDTPPASPESVRRGGGAGAGGFRGIWRCETGGSSGGEAGGADADASHGGARSRGGGARSTIRGAGGGGSDPADADPDAHTLVRLEFSPPTPPGATADGQRDSGAARARLPLSAAEREVQQLGREIAAEAARRGLRVLATQSGPATPRGSRDCRPSWEEVERAVGMLRGARAGSDPGEGDNEHTDDDDDGEASGPGEDGLDFMVY